MKIKYFFYVSAIFLISCTATPKIYIKSGDLSMELNRSAHFVRAVAYSPDGMLAVTGAFDHTLRLWDISAGRQIHQLKGHTGAVYSVVFSPDGKYVLSGSGDMTIRLWDVSTGAEVKKFVAGETSSINIVRSVGFSPDGRQILTAISGSEEYAGIRLWNVATGKEVIRFKTKIRSMQSAVFAPSGKYVLSGSADRIISLWNPVNGEEVRQFQFNEKPSALAWVWTVAFSPDGRTALSGRGVTESSGGIHLWNVTTGRELRSFKGIPGAITSVAFSPDGKKAASVNIKGIIKLWDISTGNELRQLTSDDQTSMNTDNRTVAFSPDGQFILSGGDASARIWNASTGEEIVTLIGYEDGEWLVITPSGYYNSSDRGHEYLSIRKDEKRYGMSQFYDVFYRPDIVSAQLKGEDIKGLVRLTVEEAIHNPPPNVSFSKVPSQTNDARVRICYQIQSTGGGIGEVRLFQNAKLIKSDGFYREAVSHNAKAPLKLAALNSRALYQDMRALIIKGKDCSGAAIIQPKNELVKECVELDAIAGENEISLCAFNAPNTVQSVMGTARFVSARVPDAPRLYILAVGIDRYRDTSINLKYATKDAKDFAAKMAEKSKTVYSPENIYLTTLADRQASKNNILTAVEEIAMKAKHGDSFIFFVASHGLLLQNQYYIVTSSFDGSTDHALSLISSNEIVEMSKRIKALSQLFIFDTCHAGGVDNIISGLYDARMSVLAKKMGLHIFASAGSVQTALDGYKGNGLYTHSLLTGLNNGVLVGKGNVGTVTVKSLGAYTKEMTSALSSKLGHPQTPLIVNFGKDIKLYEVR